PSRTAGPGLLAPGAALSRAARTGADVPRLVSGAVLLCPLSPALGPGAPAPPPAVGRPTAVCPAERRGPLAPQPAPGGGDQLECLARRDGRQLASGLWSARRVPRRADRGLVGGGTRRHSTGPGPHARLSRATTHPAARALRLSAGLVAGRHY